MADVEYPTQARSGQWWRLERNQVRSVVIFILSLTSGLLAWKFSSAYLINPHLLPPPEQVFSAAWTTIMDGEAWEIVQVSIVRILTGFCIGSVAGISCGLLMGSFPLVGEFLDPLIEVVRPISTVAMIPIAIVWFGIDEASKYFIIAYGTFFVTALNTLAGIRQIPLVRQRAAMSLGAGTWNLFFRITLPSAMPFINTGMRVALGGAFASVIAAEMIAANTGIGYFIMQARLLVQPERIFVGLMILGLTGFLTDRLYRHLTSTLFSRYLRLSA